MHEKSQNKYHIIWHIGGHKRTGAIGVGVLEFGLLLDIGYYNVRRSGGFLTESAVFIANVAFFV